MLRVLGIGSPFGDDRLGWEVIHRLQQQLLLQCYIPQHLQFINCDRPGMRLIELMQGANPIILIDAVKSGAAIGTLHRFQNQEIESLNMGFSTHDIGVGEALKIGRALNALPELIIFYGIEIAEIDLQADLSTHLREAIEILVEKVQGEILTLL